jgi:hypothetical protein
LSALLEELDTSAYLTPDEEAPKVDPPSGFECEKCGRTLQNKAGYSRHVLSCKGGEAAPVIGSSGAPLTPLTPKQGKPKIPAKGRTDASSLLGFIYGTAANFMPSVPAQRAMAWQAPTAGRVLDDAVAGTIIDKVVIQKIAGASNRVEPVFNLVALPLIVMAMDRQPMLGQMLYPIARRVMEGNLRAVLVSMKKEKEEAESLGALAASVGMEWETTVTDAEGKEVRMDVIDSILSKLFERAPEPEPVPV